MGNDVKIRVWRWICGLPAWTLTALCLAAIAWLTLSSKPLGDTELPLFPHADKLAHAIMFGGLAFCIMLDSLRQGRERRFRASMAVWAAVVSALVGLLTEVAQQAMDAGRSGDPLDLLADTAGAVATAAAFYPLARRRAD